MKVAKKRIFGKIFIIIGVLAITIVASLFVVFVKTTSAVSLNKSKLVIAEQTSSIKILDKNGVEIDTSNMFSDGYYAKIEDVPDHVKNGFIAVEDKRFYKHKGIDLWRMLGATVKNISSGKFSQGASTISQQLIKNTHLTNEKTITRKMKEIKLAYELEQKYSKDEILELYLNNIYFGNGCYGIEKASRYYFNKSAKELTIGEGALLVGVINAPSYYDLLSHQDRAEKRKKLVLKIMHKNNVINDAEYEKSANNAEIIVKNTSKQTNQHLKSILNEICDVLNVNENQIKNMGLTVYTSLDLGLVKKLQAVVNSSFLVPKNSANVTPSAGVLVLDNKSKSVVAIAGNMRYDLSLLKRQPGSTIKPLIAYAPAFEYGKLYPESIIIDEQININGYSPSNASKSFFGGVSVREAVARSLNIPAVKTLSNLGVERGKKFAERLGIEFHESDINLALALGGMTEGVTIKQLADAYSAFATNGEFMKSTFINKITDNNGNLLYQRAINKSQVMSEATAYMMTEVLKDVVNKGTARRLTNFNYDLAGKTGTVGVSDSSLNKDAFNVAYTSEHTIISWLGALEENAYMSSSVNGSSYPTEMTKAILTRLYSTSAPQDFSVPESIVYKDIDLRSLNENKVEIANEQVHNKYRLQSIFNKNFIPEISSKNDAHKTKLQIDMEYGEKPMLKFETRQENVYQLLRANIKTQEEDILHDCHGNGENIEYKDSSATTGEIYEYYVISYSVYSEDDKQKSNSIKVMSY